MAERGTDSGNLEAGDSGPDFRWTDRRGHKRPPPIVPGRQWRSIGGKEKPGVGFNEGCFSAVLEGSRGVRDTWHGELFGARRPERGDRSFHWQRG